MVLKKVPSPPMLTNKSIDESKSLDLLNGINSKSPSNAN